MQRYDAKNVKNGDNEKNGVFFLLPGFMRQLNLMADVVFFDRRTEVFIMTKNILCPFCILCSFCY